MSWHYCKSKEFPKIFTEKGFFFVIKIKKKDFYKFCNNKNNFYKKEKIIKKDGIRYREIYKPNIELKKILQKINKKYLSKIDFPFFIHCGPKGRSIVTAAKKHNIYNYHLSLDIDSFFDNIKKDTLKNTLEKIGLNRNIINLICDISIEDDKAPQGFPTSPLLSALVISVALENFYSFFNKEEILLSVYADDILISSNNKNKLNEAEIYIKEQFKLVGLSLNSTKREFGQKGTSFKWLGLQIHPWVSIPRRNLVILQKQVYEYKNKNIIPNDFKSKKTGNRKEKFEQHIKGKLLFIKSVNKNKLTDKIAKLLSVNKR
jgi:hypothetical protein